MKTKFLKFSPVILLFAFLIAACQKDDVFEIKIGDVNPVIVQEVNGIEFTFCLLNEQGEPATVFNEGENFIFQFSIKNLKKDTIIITTEFINDEFFRVYRLSGDNPLDLGKPWSGIWCEYSLEPHEIKVAPSKTSKVQSPWNFFGDFYDYYPPLCVTGKENLTEGEYLTGFDLDFHYKLIDESYNINNLKFKINFKIK